MVGMKQNIINLTQGYSMRNIGKIRRNYLMSQAKKQTENKAPILKKVIDPLGKASRYLLIHLYRNIKIVQTSI